MTRQKESMQSRLKDMENTLKTSFDQISLMENQIQTLRASQEENFELKKAASELYEKMETLRSSYEDGSLNLTHKWVRSNF